MDEMVIFEGEELDALMRQLEWIRDRKDAADLRRVRFALDGGLKIKVNEHTWSPPLGRLERISGR